MLGVLVDAGLLAADESARYAAVDFSWGVRRLMASDATIVRRFRRAPNEAAARAVARGLTLAELETVACWVAERWTITPASGSLQLSQRPEPPSTGYRPVHT